MAQRDDLPATKQLPPGTDIGGYVIERKLGVGGMSVVYGAVQPRIGKRVAIKVLSRTFDDPSAVQRFEQEARIVNAIGHQNIVDVFQFGELPDGRSFFVMEWLDGETLGARLKRGPLALPVTIAILEEICGALEAAHEQGVVHRDLKADNVFLVTTRRGRAVKLLDFGLAKLVHGDGAESVHHTGIGILVGTPSYMAPEQARARDVDARTDIYSLGCLAFQMLTGQLPFRADNPLDLLNLHLDAPPPSAASIVAGVPRALSDLVKQMMAKAPEDRPSLARVQLVLAQARDSKASKSGVGRRGLWALVGACVVGSAVVIGLVVAPRFRDRAAASTPSPSPSGPGSGRVAATTAADAGTTSGVDPREIEMQPEPAAAAKQPPSPPAPTSPPPPSTPERTPARATTAQSTPPAPTTQPPPPSSTTPAGEDVRFPGVLVITVDVAADIEIDGTVRETNSRGGRFELRPGKHAVRITAPGRPKVERDVDIQTAMTINMAVSLPANPGSTSTRPAVDAGTTSDEPGHDGSAAPPE